MTSYEFPTHLNDIFEGALSSAEHRSTSRNWWDLRALTILEAAALHCGMDPYFVQNYVDSFECDIFARAFFYSVVQELISAVLAGEIRAVDLDKPSTKHDLTGETVVYADDVKEYFAKKKGTSRRRYNAANHRTLHF